MPMRNLGAREEARAKVLADARCCMDRIRAIAACTFDDPDQAMDVLQRLRAESYEDLNQIQHEYLILCAVEWLVDQGLCARVTEWYWNPRQTGDHAEPDLLGKTDGTTIVSAEVTTSARPDGVIDTRMRKTLDKLSQQPGQRFYFVRTAAMANRAATKARKANWDIRVVQLAPAHAGDG